MTEHRRQAWFRAKRYGYGAGLPIAWQGWLALGIFMVLMICPALAVPVAARHGNVAVVGLLVVPLLFVWPFVSFCRDRTEGEWKWRWGDHEVR